MYRDDNDHAGATHAPTSASTPTNTAEPAPPSAPPLLSLTTLALADILRDAENSPRERRLAAAVLLRYVASVTPRPSSPKPPSPPKHPEPATPTPKEYPGPFIEDIHPLEFKCTSKEHDLPPRNPIRQSDKTDPERAYWGGYWDGKAGKTATPPSSIFPLGKPRRFPYFLGQDAPSPPDSSLLPVPDLTINDLPLVGEHPLPPSRGTGPPIRERPLLGLQDERVHVRVREDPVEPPVRRPVDPGRLPDRIEDFGRDRPRVHELLLGEPDRVPVLSHLSASHEGSSCVGSEDR